MSVTLSARDAICIFHKLQLPDKDLPNDSVKVTMCFVRLKRCFAKPPKKAMKLTMDSLRRVRDHLMGGDPVSLKKFRMAAWAVEAWHCMGPYEELAKVMFENVKGYIQPSKEARGLVSRTFLNLPGASRD